MDVCDLIDELPEETLSALVSAMECAGSCENVADFKANIQDAIENALALANDLRALRDRLKNARGQ